MKKNLTLIKCLDLIVISIIFGKVLITCKQCCELFESYIGTSRELQYFIGKQKLEAARQRFQSIQSIQPEIERLQTSRGRLLEKIIIHAATHQR
jgi:hypothetical protein